MINGIDNSNNTSFQAALKIYSGTSLNPKQIQALEKNFAEKTKSILPKATLNVEHDGFVVTGTDWERIFWLHDEGTKMLKTLSPRQLMNKLLKLFGAYQNEMESIKASDEYLSSLLKLFKDKKLDSSIEEDFAYELAHLEGKLRDDMYNEVFASDSFLKYVK